MWIFGYGSLTWKADFPYERKLEGYVTGFIRRFYQHSIDHRGVPEQPGRVVTLLPGNSQDRVYGVAYLIAPDKEESVIAHLDHREKNGYKKETITFFPVNPKETPFELTIYIATESNDSFAGSAELSSIAFQIFESRGPSGLNKDYLYNLATAMRSIAPEYADDHLFTLEKLVQQLDNNVNDDDINLISF